MTVTVGGTPTGTFIEGGGVSSVNIAHTAAGVNRAAWVAVGFSAGSPPTGCNATYGGNTMVPAYPIVGSGLNFRSQAFYLAGDNVISSGSASAVANFTGATADEAHLTVISARDVSPHTPAGPVITSNTNSATPSVTAGSVNSGDMVVDCLYAGGGLAAASSGPGANQTLGVENVDSFGGYHGSSYQAGVDGGVMSWSLTGLPAETTLGAMTFKPAGSGGREFDSRTRVENSVVLSNGVSLNATLRSRWPDSARDLGRSDQVEDNRTRSLQ